MTPVSMWGGSYFVEFKDESTAAIALLRDLAARYPELEGIRASHAWRGPAPVSHGTCCLMWERTRAFTTSTASTAWAWPPPATSVTKVAQRIMGGPRLRDRLRGVSLCRPAGQLVPHQHPGFTASRPCSTEHWIERNRGLTANVECAELVVTRLS